LVNGFVLPLKNSPASSVAADPIPTTRDRRKPEPFRV
jgi:hypothetical protein